MPTIFERIARGEIPSYKVWEDEHHFAFLDINPRVRGHTLVIPRRATDGLFDMDAKAYAALWAAAAKVADKLKRELQCARVCVGVYGFEVPHVHIHLFPANELADVPIPPVNERAKAELPELARRLAM